MRIRADSRELDKIYKRRDRYEIPEWQRQEVWGQSKKQNLIDTILRGWKLPKFYFQKTSDDPETFEVVDGQQRLAAIFEFFDGELDLSPASAKWFGAKTYSGLSDTYADAIDDYKIEFDVIEDADEADVKELFQRLQEGLPTTSSEKLNSVHSRLRDFLSKSTKHPFFNKVVASNRRHGHFDILSKVAAIEIDGIDVGLRYDDLRAVFESQATFSSRSNVAKRLSDALDFVDAGFKEPSAHLRNRTIVQSLLTLVARLIQSDRVAGKEEEIAEFFSTFMKELSHQVELGQRATDPEYLRFQRTVSANVRTGARTRQEILLRKLLAHNPSFAEVLDPAVAAESGIQTASTASAGNIVTLIGQANVNYAAEEGHDLFKATNKTAQAQASLGKPVRSFEDYKAFVEHLYFLFHESVGSRLDGNVPDSFKDVSLLRTGLQHDVDHGKTSEVRRKRRRIADAFSKYAGDRSPESLAPHRFPVMQANILGAIERDLRALKW